jgi:membrane associated rhomboid family serine protease
MTQPYDDSRYSFGPSQMSPGVKYLLVITVAIYVAELLPGVGSLLMKWGALIPSVAFRGEVWRFVTYMFLHDPSPLDPWHLLFNMLGLWMFGVIIERMWGTSRFVYFYLLSGAGSGMLSFYLKNGEIIGASGAIYALLTVFAYYFPKERILLFFIIPVSARTAVILFGVISIVFALNSYGGVAHLTHLGGIVIAILYCVLFPRVEAFWAARRETWQAGQQQRADAHHINEARVFEEEIDPILKKISEQGMDSLTAKERRTLNNASQRQKAKIAHGKIIPFDLFK